MNKTELLNKADELEKVLQTLRSLINKEEEIILVPNEIKISKEWYKLAIHNWKHKLYYETMSWTWLVLDWMLHTYIQCKLTPCEYKDLKPWDVFYRSDNENTGFKDLAWYAIKLNNWTYQYWGNKNCVNSNNNIWKHYWKVEPINS